MAPGLEGREPAIESHLQTVQVQGQQDHGTRLVLGQRWMSQDGGPGCRETAMGCGDGAWHAGPDSVVTSCLCDSGSC